MKLLEDPIPACSAPGSTKTPYFMTTKRRALAAPKLTVSSVISHVNRKPGKQKRRIGVVDGVIAV
jgi:hypothetical protein